MKCNSKTMLGIAAAMAAALVAAYFSFPDFHAWIVASAPILLSLVCPIAMLLMMKGMHGQDRQAARPEAQQMQDEDRARSTTR